jgi:hypothetical protein
MAAPYSTTIQTVRDGICAWFGGSYDPASRSYRTPQVPMLGVVRRSRPKVDDAAEYYLGQPSAGSLVGSQMLVHVDGGIESREAMAGAFGGLKLLRSTCTLHLFLRSNSEWAEDATDGFYDLLEALKARIRADRCLGSGGFEAGGFVVGEGGSPWLRWSMGMPETSSEMTSGYLTISFEVHYYAEG